MSAPPCVPIHSFIDPDEFAYYTHLVASNYRGSGLIVDGGCFAGASTLALCRGLPIDLPPSERRRVVAIDRFVATDPYVVEHFSTTDADVRFGESFLPVFLDTVADHLEHIEIRAGELVQVGRIQAPIAILVVDIAKSTALNAYITLNWLPRLVPGESLIVHQDFYAPSHPWIAISLGALMDYFSVHQEKVGESAVFRLERTIPAEVLARVAQIKTNAPEAAVYLERMIATISPENNMPLRLMHALLFHRLGQPQKARARMADILRSEPPTDAKWERWLSFALVAIDPAAFVADRRLASSYLTDAAIRMGS